MVHPEYHTCDRCGKKISITRKLNGNVRIAYPSSGTEQDFANNIANAIVKEYDGCGWTVTACYNIWPFYCQDNYELCSKCANEAHKILTRFIN